MAAKAKKSTESKQARAKPAPSKTIDLIDEDDVVPAPPKKRAPAKSMKDESSSEVEMFEAPKKIPKAKTVKVDSDSEMVIVPAPPAKGKAKETTKRKRYAVFH